MQTAEPANKELPLLEPETGIYETYANMFDADWTMTDVTLRFMHLIFSAETDRATLNSREMCVLEKANITIPWLTAKTVADVLMKLVVAHEAVNGELKQPVLARLEHDKKPSSRAPKKTS